MGVVMRLPPGLTLQMLSNFYNSHKRHWKMINNGIKNNSNAIREEMRTRQRIITNSGLSAPRFVNYFHRYSKLRKANKNLRIRRGAGKFRAGGSVSVLRPALRRELGAFGNNYGNILRSVAYRNASPIRQR